MRGLLYEARGSEVTEELLAAGERTARSIAQRSAIPLAVLRADPHEREHWLGEAQAAIEGLLTRA